MYLLELDSHILERVDSGNLGASIEEKTTLRQHFQPLLRAIVLLQNLVEKPALQGIKTTMVELQGKLTSNTRDMKQSHRIVSQE